MLTLSGVSLLELLALLGFFLSLSDSVPEDPGVRVSTDASGRRSWTKVQHRKAPGFMMDLYEQQVQNSTVLQGTVVRSFPGRSDDTFHVFNLTSLGQRERIMKAEFRWFRPVLTRVDLYQVLESRERPWRGNLITSRSIPVDTGGWEVFDITQTVTQWIHSNRTENSIMVLTSSSSSSSSSSPSSSSPSSSSPSSSSSSSSSGPMMETDTQTAPGEAFQTVDAYLVLYSDDEGQIPESPLFLEYQSPPQAPVRRRRAGKENPVACRRTPLYVDFAKLGWSSWIISPKGYNAYHCSGSCPFPLGGNLRATNHAIVQSIVNTLKLSQEVGGPCCVPDHLHPISLLYFDDEENVVLKRYDDMVAGSCGCH